MKIALLSILLAGSFVPPKVPVKAFTPEDFKRFQKMEKEQEETRRDIRTAEKIFSTFGCRSDQLPVLTTQAARKQHLSVRIVAAVVVVESSCQSRAVSPRGAVGLMQVSPHLWHMSRVSLMDPETNINKGTEILARYEREYGTRDGFRHYFGLGPDDGEITCDDYANRVMHVAYGGAK